MLPLTAAWFRSNSRSPFLRLYPASLDSFIRANREQSIARQEPTSLSTVHLNTWRNTSFKFARLLLDPEGGDVVFVARGTVVNSRKKLYAYKSILAGNSEYFASRKFHLEIILKLYRPESRMERPKTTF